jgi:hypothetical protein
LFVKMGCACCKGKGDDERAPAKSDRNQNDKTTRLPGPGLTVPQISLPLQLSSTTTNANGNGIQKNVPIASCQSLLLSTDPVHPQDIKISESLPARPYRKDVLPTQLSGTASKEFQRPKNSAAIQTLPPITSCQPPSVDADPACPATLAHIEVQLTANATSAASTSGSVPTTPPLLQHGAPPPHAADDDATTEPLEWTEMLRRRFEAGAPLPVRCPRAPWLPTAAAAAAAARGGGGGTARIAAASGAAAVLTAGAGRTLCPEPTRPQARRGRGCFPVA